MAPPSTNQHSTKLSTPNDSSYLDQPRGVSVLSSFEPCFELHDRSDPFPDASGLARVGCSTNASFSRTDELDEVLLFGSTTNFPNRRSYMSSAPAENTTCGSVPPR